MIRKRVYGKIGELVQGMTSQHRPFHLTNLTSGIFYSETTITLNSDPASLREKSSYAVDGFFALKNHMTLPELKSVPLHQWKRINSFEMERFNDQYSIHQKSNIPVGKGLSSSSADILSVLCALDEHYQTRISLPTMYELASLIEPTDPCLSDHGWIFDSSSGALLEKIQCPDFRLIYFDSDPQLSVDTASIHEAKYDDKDCLAYDDIIKQFRSINANSFSSFCNIITHSAELSNRKLPKAQFAKLLLLGQQYNAGVFVGHTGTIMGLAMNPLAVEAHKREIADYVRKHWRTNPILE